jgi:hypothetical protein
VAVACVDAVPQDVADTEVVRPPRGRLGFRLIGPRIAVATSVIKREQEGGSLGAGDALGMRDPQVRGRWREGGVEPPRPFGHRVLKRLRLRTGSAARVVTCRVVPSMPVVVDLS